MAAATSRHRLRRRNARTRAATLLLHAVLLLCAAAPLRPVSAGNIQDQVKDWLDWITGKDAQQPSGGDPAEPPGTSSSLTCSPRAGTTTCILTPTVGDPDPFALHKLLRFPQHGASLGTAQPGPLHVVITGGAYVSIPLTIPDNAHITVEAGAALVFNSTDTELYNLWFDEALPTYGRGLDAGGPLRYRAHLDCDRCSNVKIDGGGIIDGGGQRWWEVWAAKQAGDSDAARFLSKDRPSMLEFRSCTDVIVTGVTFQNAPYWAMHPYNCSRFSVQQVTIRNPPSAPDTAGIVIDSTTDAVVQLLDVSTGGDCVMVKSGLAGRPQLATRNVSITDVSCMAPGHSGLSLGPELAGGLYNVSAVRWVLNDTQHGVRLQTRWGQPGHVHNVLAQLWRLNASVADMLSIETGPNAAPAKGWARLHMGNITVTDVAPNGASAPLVRITGGTPFWLGGFHVDGDLRRRVSCWRPVWVGGICQASPGFLIFLWALATLVICAALGAGAGLAAWTGGLWLWRRLHYWDRMDDLPEPEETMDLEAVELVNVEARRNRQLAVQDSLQDPEVYVQGREREKLGNKLQLPLK